MASCDILDRERLRIELDSPGGFFIRFQYLDIPLSPAEQASFLTKCGDQVQDVVTTGFQRVEKTLNRLLCIAESEDVFDGVHVNFALKRSYAAAEIGHFRAFVHLSLRAIKHDILTIWFGSTDRSARYRDDAGQLAKDYGNEPGIGAGIAGGQWERQLHLDAVSEHESMSSQDDAVDADSDETTAFTPVGWSDGAGLDPIRIITVNYGHDDKVIRFRPRLSLRDLDDCSFMPIINRSLAEKLYAIQVFANGYKIADFGPDDFKVDDSKWQSHLPGGFTPEELLDPWVRIRRSSLSSNWQLGFYEVTPRRMYGHKEPRDTTLPDYGS